MSEEIIVYDGNDGKPDVTDVGSIELIDPRAVGSGWVGSQAVKETGQRWMTAARRELRLNSAGWMSEMVGRSKEFRITITSSNHNFNTNTLHSWMLNAAGGSWPGSNAQWRIVVNSGVQLVCHSTGAQTMWFGGGINGKVIIENNGWIFGRGGGGGSAGKGYANNGGGGGHAIFRESKIQLEIINNGIIAGGGGGGGGGWQSAPYGGASASGGGGGAPFGGGGGSESGGGGGGGASITGGGAGGHKEQTRGGAGGGLGGGGGAGQGGSGRGQGGASGYAIAGSGSIVWTKRGDIRGPTS